MLCRLINTFTSTDVKENGPCERRESNKTRARQRNITVNVLQEHAYRDDRYFHFIKGR